MIVTDAIDRVRLCLSTGMNLEDVVEMTTLGLVTGRIDDVLLRLRRILIDTSQVKVVASPLHRP